MRKEKLLFPHGELTGNEVLIDLLEDNRRRLGGVLDKVSDAGLYWKPDPKSNNIALTIWHMGRLIDVFLHLHTMGAGAEAECWIKGGWKQSTNYDPRGKGADGWGMINGYTEEELAEIPQLTRTQLLGYLDQVYDAFRAYLCDTPMTELTSAAPGFDRRYTKYQCVTMALADNLRHLGEIYALKTMWDRQQGKTDCW